MKEMKVETLQRKFVKSRL